MTREEALYFVNALNSIQPYVPPLLFERITGGALKFAAVANGMLVCEFKPPEEPKVPDKKETGAS